jgi:hypothetical protein
VNRWAADGIALSERTHDLHEGALRSEPVAADGIALSERIHDLHEGALRSEPVHEGALALRDEGSLALRARSPAALAPLK